MPSFLDQIGIQSYCFRHFKDNVKVAQLLKECGLSRIELCGVHVDFNQPAGFAKVIETYNAAGVKIASIGVETFRNDEAAEEKRFEFCKAAGASIIACDFALEQMPACIPTAVKLADKYDMRLAIHNHGGRHWLGSAKMLEHILMHNGPRIGLCLDTAWALDSREDPIGLAQRNLDRLYAVHIKDFIFNRARQPEDVVIGTGNLDLPKLMQILKASPTLGSTILEYEGSVENPVPALRQCVEELRKNC